MINDRSKFDRRPASKENVLKLAHNHRYCYCDHVHSPWNNIETPLSPESSFSDNFSLFFTASIKLSGIKMSFSQSSEGASCWNHRIRFREEIPVPPQRSWRICFPLSGSLKTTFIRAQCWQATIGATGRRQLPWIIPTATRHHHPPLDAINYRWTTIEIFVTVKSWTLLNVTQ